MFERVVLILMMIMTGGLKMSSAKDDQQNQVTSRDNQSYQENELQQTSTPNKEQEWIDFVGRNYDYYKFKWLKSDDPEKALTWNWTAFFLGFLWLGYRKMYKPILILLSLYLGLELIELLTVFDPTVTVITTYFPLIIAVFLGMFGNALYYRHAKKKIEKIRTLYPGTRMQINLGGTSGKGVITAIGINVGYAIIYAIAFMILTNGSILFGTGHSALGVSNYKQSFSHNDAIYYDVRLSEKANADHLDVFVYLIDQDREKQIGYFEQEVDSNTRGFSDLFITPYYDYDGIITEADHEPKDIFNPGHYIVRVYRDTELLSEGHFEIE